MLVSFLSYLIIIPSAFMCYLPMRNQLRFSLGKIHLLSGLLCLVMIPIGVWLETKHSVNPNLILFPMMGLFFIVYHLSLKTDLCKSVAVFFWVVGLMAILSNFANAFDALMNPNLGADIVTLDFVVIQLALAFFFLLVFFYPLRKYASSLVNQLNVRRVWYITVPFSLIFVSVNVFLRPMHYESLYVHRIFQAYWTILSTTLLLYLLLSVCFFFVVTGILDKAKTKERNQLLEMQESQFLSQQKYINESAKVRHDFRQVIHTLHEMVEAKDYDAIEGFVDEYEKSMPHNDVVHYCNNVPLNALLNYYCQIAQLEEIDFNLRIALPEQLPLTDIDLCGMIGNILSNATHACRRVEPQNRWIQLTVITKNESQLFIVATNSFDGRVKMRDGRYFSTDRSGDGIGLESIRSTAERCGGTAQFSHREREFYTDIVLPL